MIIYAMVKNCFFATRIYNNCCYSLNFQCVNLKVTQILYVEFMLLN